MKRVVEDLLVAMAMVVVAWLLIGIVNVWPGLGALLAALIGAGWVVTWR